MAVTSVSGISARPPTTEWSGGPSQLTNVGLFCALAVLVIAGWVLCAKLGAPAWAYLALVLPFAALAGWGYLTVASIQYTFDADRLRSSTGVLNRITNDLQLYRVRDFQIEQPFNLRAFGLGSIKILTSDRTSPTLYLHAIPNVRAVADRLSACVEDCRQRKGTRELDVE